MKKSVLLMGCSDSRHIYNYIDIVLSDKATFDRISIFNVAYIKDTPKDFVNYYVERNITVLNPKREPLFNNTVIGSVSNFLERTSALYNHLKKNRYDYLIIHYCSWQAMRWVELFGRYFKKVFLVFYGGDVLRNKSVDAKFYHKAYQRSFSIVLPNEHSYNVFNNKTSGLYKDKTSLIQFPQKMVRTYLESEQKLPPRQQILKKFGYPNDKIIVVCGHTATRAERYEEIINQILNVPKVTRDKCYWVFMMTYAPGEYKTYQEEIGISLFKNNIDGCIMKQYLDYDQIQELHSVSDIHITNILTDALSCFLQEQMLSGSVLIYGKWLHYDDIENSNFYAIPYENITELNKIITKVVENIDDYKEKSQINREAIINLASEETIRTEWNKLFKDDLI